MASFDRTQAEALGFLLISSGHSILRKLQTVLQKKKKFPAISCTCREDEVSSPRPFWKVSVGSHFLKLVQRPAWYLYCLYRTHIVCLKFELIVSEGKSQSQHHIKEPSKRARIRATNTMKSIGTFGCVYIITGLVFFKKKVTKTSKTIQTETRKN